MFELCSETFFLLSLPSYCHSNLHSCAFHSIESVHLYTFRLMPSIFPSRFLCPHLFHSLSHCLHFSSSFAFLFGRFKNCLVIEWRELYTFRKRMMTRDKQSMRRLFLYTHSFLRARLTSECHASGRVKKNIQSSHCLLNAFFDWMPTRPTHHSHIQSVSQHNSFVWNVILTFVHHRSIGFVVQLQRFTDKTCKQ